MRGNLRAALASRIARAGAGSTRAVLLAALLAACAPRVDAPLDEQRARDRADSDRVAQQLQLLPGAVAARVELHGAARDPLAAAPPSPATASAVLVVDDAADRAMLAARATALVRAAAPAVAAPTIVVEVGAHRAELARVGPFTVEAASRGPLRATLAAALALIAALAAWIGWRYRARPQ